MEYYILLIAVIIDLVVGDPEVLPHPVVLIGQGIEYLELHFRKVFTGQKGLKVAGFLLVLIIVVSTYLISWVLLYLLSGVNHYLGLVISIWLFSTTIAVKGLVEAGRTIYQSLVTADLEGARKKLGWIVGRDTESLAEAEIVRGTIETLAENTSDGIIAPLVYGGLGGVPLAVAYKAVNTLDSMVAYKNEKYKDFGWAAAKIDDLANWIPARLTGGLFIIAAFILGKDWQLALKTVIKDASKHPSPNAGIPEAAVAGALNIRLGGTNYYQGQKSFKAYLGTQEVKFRVEQIQETIRLIYLATALFVGATWLTF